MTNTSITPTLPIATGRWTLDPAHSTVGFTVRHLGISKVRGAFRDVDAELAVGDGVADSAVSATIQLASVDTGVADRDNHLRAADLLDVANRPEMTFRSTGIAHDADGWRLRGELSIGEVTNEVELAVEFGGLEQFALDGRAHAGFEARGSLRRRDFGLDFGPADLVVGDVVHLELDLQFVPA